VPGTPAPSERDQFTGAAPQAPGAGDMSQSTALATTEHAAPAHGAHTEPTNTGASHAKLAMWIFLASDALFFGAFIATYLLYRGRDELFMGGPKPSELYDIPFTSATSFILLMSSLTMVLALAAILRGDDRRFRIWILATALFGLTFIGGQVFEFTEFYREGQHLNTNLFGTTFFVLTGFHGAHVTLGIVWLLSLWFLSMRGRIHTGQAEAVETAGLYWHFVDVVWIVIFTVIYLVPQN
jgi:cytochrome c oxidase subunit 3/cytochrome o ubiquinol oxidase subunit 3